MRGLYINEIVKKILEFRLYFQSYSLQTITKKIIFTKIHILAERNVRANMISKLSDIKFLHPVRQRFSSPVVRLEIGFEFNRFRSISLEIFRDRSI